MFLILSVIDKDKVNIYLNQEDKEDKEVILEAYQALSQGCSNPSFFLKKKRREAFIFLCQKKYQCKSKSMAFFYSCYFLSYNLIFLSFCQRFAFEENENKKVNGFMMVEFEQNH